MMKTMMVPKKQKRLKLSKSKSNLGSRSNVLKKIIECLYDEEYGHMLRWTDINKKELIIKFVHMNSPEWKKADYLKLFRELDKLSNKYEDYVKDEKYQQKCKVRCKSNLRKLCKSKALTLLGTIKTKKEGCIEERKYKLNCDDLPNIMKSILKDKQKTEGYNVNGFSSCETVPAKSTHAEIQPNEQSHFLCLSNSSINIYLTLPPGASIISDKSPAVPALLESCCTRENKNENTRSTILQIDPLTVYEHERQMNEKVDEPLIVLEELPRTDEPKEILAYSELGRIHECNGLEDMRTSQPDDMDSGNATSDFSESFDVSRMKADEPLIVLEEFPRTDEPKEILAYSELGRIHGCNELEDMRASQLDDMDSGNDTYGVLESSGVSRMKMENFQGCGVESQLVPSNSGVDEFLSHSSSEWSMDTEPDYHEILQREDDPLLSSTSSGDLERNNFPLFYEDFYSFENFVSSYPDQ